MRGNILMLMQGKRVSWSDEGGQPEDNFDLNESGDEIWKTPVSV